MLYYLLLLWIFLIPIHKYICNGSIKTLKRNNVQKILLYIKLKSIDRNLTNKKRKKIAVYNIVDFYIKKFACSSFYEKNEKLVYDLDKINRYSKTFDADVDANVDLLDIQNEINKNVKKSLNEKRFKNIFENKKRYCANSKNPPYVFHPLYSNIDIKRQHRFKIKKYENIFIYLNESTLYDSNYFIPFCTIHEVVKYMQKVHDQSFIDKMLNIIRNKEEVEMYELDLFSDIICRFLVEVSGTILSSLLSLKYFISMHIGGGNHHSKKHRGDGFCIFNDIAIAIYFLLHNKIVENVIVLDLDVHQGDGTAEIFENSKNVKTISLHCKNNYPTLKKKSTIDIELDPYVKDDKYLSIYQTVLNNIKEKESSIIFYLAGVDISKDDDLGFLLISDEGIYKRDYLTYQMAIKNKIPIVTVLSGGYNECEKTLMQKHILTFKAAKDSWSSIKR